MNLATKRFNLWYFIKDLIKGSVHLIALTKVHFVYKILIQASRSSSSRKMLSRPEYHPCLLNCYFV